MKTHLFFYAPDPDDTGSTGDDSSSTVSDESTLDDSSSSSSDGGNDDSSSDTSTTDDTSSADDSSSDSSSDTSTTDDTSSADDSPSDSSSDTSTTDDASSADDSSGDSSSDTSTTDDTSSADDSSGDSSSDTATMDDTSSTSGEISPPVRPYAVESWRELVTQFADGMPVEVLLRWIKHESGGNPCSTGKIVNGSSIENGLFQLYHPDDDRFASPSQLHGSFCNGQTCTRDLTLEEAKIQVTSGIAYVKSCRERARAQLKKAGVTWDESGSDFWSLVKMQHNLPGIPAKYIPMLKPSSWAEFKNGVIQKEPKYKGSSIFSNAEDIGSAAS